MYCITLIVAFIPYCKCNEWLLWHTQRYCDGDELFDYIDENGPLSNERYDDDDNDDDDDTNDHNRIRDCDCDYYYYYIIIFTVIIIIKSIFHHLHVLIVSVYHYVSRNIHCIITRSASICTCYYPCL